MYGLPRVRASKNAMYKLHDKELVETFSSHAHVCKFPKKLVSSPIDQVSSQFSELNLNVAKLTIE